MAVITISKEYACDIETFARNLADKLGYSILDKSLVSQVAKEIENRQKEQKSFVGESHSRLLDLIDKYTATIIQRVVDLSYRRLDDKAYYEVTQKLVLQAAHQNDVIIVGWGGQCILKDHSRAIHLRIVKNLADRIGWLKVHAGLDEKSAADLIDREESESAEYIRHYFNRAWDDSHLYHAVLNLSKLSPNRAADVVVRLVETHAI